MLRLGHRQSSSHCGASTLSGNTIHRSTIALMDPCPACDDAAHALQAQIERREITRRLSSSPPASADTSTSEAPLPPAAYNSDRKERICAWVPAISSLSIPCRLEQTHSRRHVRSASFPRSNLAPLGSTTGSSVL